MGLFLSVLMICLGVAVALGLVTFVFALAVVAAIERFDQRHRPPF